MQDEDNDPEVELIASVKQQSSNIKVPELIKSSKTKSKGIDVTPMKPVSYKFDETKIITSEKKKEAVKRLTPYQESLKRMEIIY